jgi:hypothetical protein
VYHSLGILYAQAVQLCREVHLHSVPYAIRDVYGGNACFCRNL